MAYYFAYGSNLNEEQMRRRCSDSKPVGIATLKDYKLIFNGHSKGWNGGVADIKKESGKEVIGIIYEVSEKDLESLDEHEGVHKKIYKRIIVEVTDDKGKKKEVVAYEKEEKGKMTKPSENYLDTIIKSARKNGFPKKYLKEIRENMEFDDEGMMK